MTKKKVGIVLGFPLSYSETKFFLAIRLYRRPDRMADLMSCLKFKIATDSNRSTRKFYYSILF